MGFPSHLRDKACTCASGNRLSQKRLKGMHIPAKDPGSGLTKHLLWPDISLKTLYVSLISAQVMVYHLIYLLSFPLILKYINYSLSIQNF